VRWVASLKSAIYVAVIAVASALAVIAAPCAIQGSQGILGTSPVGSSQTFKCVP
jgi:hypothetical protein